MSPPTPTMHQLSILIKNPLIVIIHNILPLKHCQNNPYPPGVPKKYVAMMPPALPVSPEYLNTTVNPKESSQICSHGPSCTTCLPRILEYNSLSSETLPFGPISLLPPVQSLPIGNTCPEDIQRRLTPHLSDLLRHPL